MAGVWGGMAKNTTQNRLNEKGREDINKQNQLRCRTTTNTENKHNKKTWDTECSMSNECCREPLLL